MEKSQTFPFAFYRENDKFFKIIPLSNDIREADPYIYLSSIHFMRNAHITLRDDGFVVIDSELIKLIDYDFYNQNTRDRLGVLERIHPSYKKKTRTRKRFALFGKKREEKYIDPGLYFPDIKHPKLEKSRLVCEFHKSKIFLDYTILKKITEERRGTKK